MSLGARRTSRPAATTFARNDLLFTMSDNTRMHERPGGAYACANSFSDEPMAHSRTSIEMESLQADRITAGGARRDRTDDLLLAKQALSQLSYGPALRHPAKAGMVGLGRFELPTSRLSSARSNQLSYRPNSIQNAQRFDPRPKTRCGQKDAPTTHGMRGLVREERETKTAKSR